MLHRRADKSLAAAPTRGGRTALRRRNPDRQLKEHAPVSTLAPPPPTVIGAGDIAAETDRHRTELVEVVRAAYDWEIDAFRLFDLDPAAAGRFAAAVAKDTEAEPVVAEKVEEAFTDCDLVVLTTVAGEPHLHNPQLLAHNPVVLHLSLRDLAPEMILAARNFTDDVDHAVRERTSLHPTEERTGNRDFIDGTLADLLCERLRRDHGRPAIFSPFGLRVLDLAVGKWVHDRFP
ncbi:hypothetical protein QFW82_01330 [Streptomyces malaysiensis subsp. malaysiensis]|nr:hypothetical protein [Streptomyces sp. NA07423]WHX15746.1 hypothetical protein QFW82_01330 [Streptomyces sp. NA07423]